MAFSSPRRSWECFYCIMGSVFLLYEMMIIFSQLIHHEKPESWLLTVMNHYWHDTTMIWQYKRVSPRFRTKGVLKGWCCSTTSFSEKAQKKDREKFLIKFVLVVVLLCFNYKHLVVRHDRRGLERNKHKTHALRAHSFTTRKRSWPEACNYEA